MYLTKTKIKEELNKMSDMEKLAVTLCTLTSIVALCILAYVLVI